ncbi:MAG TPA: hypothetical protein VNZ45_08490 [Bacteroidia bacterium]|nr:hypothetical protein [Bacteroidia bacterium]
MVFVSVFDFRRHFSKNKVLHNISGHGEKDDGIILNTILQVSATDS